MSTNRTVLWSRTPSIIALAGLFFTLNCAMADESHHEGMFVGVRGGQIAFVDRYRIGTHVYPLTNFVRVMRNGREASLSDLQRGDSIQIMTETRFRMEYVIAIEAVASDAPG